MPRAIPPETRAAHSSSSGVFTRRTACRMESGIGASASALMNSFASTVSFATSSDAARAALVYPSVAVASCFTRSELDTFWIAASGGGGVRSARGEGEGVRTDAVASARGIETGRNLHPNHRL